jgi:hypothetical protein
VNQIEALVIFNLRELTETTDLKSIYRRLALKAHPDKGGNTETFIKVATAYQTLLKHQKALAYKPTMRFVVIFYSNTYASTSTSTTYSSTSVIM